MDISEIAVSMGGRSLAVRVGGPPGGPAVVLLPATEDDGSLDEVCRRLHESGLRTYLVPTVTDLTSSDVRGLPEALGVGWAQLVGEGEGAELAWRAAAEGFGRFSCLVVAGAPHPAVLGDAACRPVELDTTILVGADEASRANAEASRFFVRGEFRVVPLAVTGAVSAESPAALAGEVALRSSTW